MKKILFTLLSVVAMASCTAFTHSEHEHEHNHEHSHNHEMVEKSNSFKIEDSPILKDKDKVIGNFHSKKGFKHSHLMIVTSPNLDVAVVRIDGMEYELYRQVSASGEVYSTADGKLTVMLHQNEAYVEKNGEKIEYFNLGTEKLNYGKSHSHDHH